MPRHAVPLVDQTFDEIGGRLSTLIRTGFRRRGAGSDPIELGQEQRDRPAHAQVSGALDVALEQVFDFLLSGAGVFRRGLHGALGIETEQYRVTVGKELLDRLV